MSDTIPASGCVISGYKLEAENLLEAEVDDAGDVLNPDLILPTNVLCEKCRPLMIEAEARITESQIYSKPIPHPGEHPETLLASMPYYSSTDEKRDAAKKGCYICGLLLGFQARPAREDDQRRGGPPNSVDSISLFVSVNQLNGKYPLTLRIRNQFEIGNRTGSGAYSFVKTGQLSIIPCKSHYDHDEKYSVLLSASNASELTFRLAASWLQPFRVEQHDISFNASSAPKRLVDVRPKDRSQIRIIYPRDQSVYLSVSHCWGNPETHGLTLNEDTYMSLTEGYQYSKLPRLFRDFVHVTRRLGFRYVWIDSLCILQDNDEDKFEEIRKMGDIYAGSFCNIAAVSAQDGRSSLFTKRLPLGNRCYNRLTETPPAIGFLDLTADTYGLPEPLYERAWVLQERLLAPRVIEYTHEGTRWHCNIRNSNTPGIDWSITVNGAWMYLLELRNTELTEETKVVGQTKWMDIVEQYSRSKITDEKDRELALLGVISVLQKRTGLSIVCGVCEDFMPYSLLWSTEQENTLSQHSSYSGPSWSSTFSPVHSFQHGKPYQVMKKEPQCQNWSVDRGTSLLRVTGWSNSTLTIEWNSTKHYTAVFHSSIESVGPSESTLYADNGDYCNLTMAFDYVSLGTIEVDLLLLVVDRNFSEVAIGLILIRDDAETCVWKRTGLFTCREYRTLSDFFRVEKTYQIK